MLMGAKKLIAITDSITFRQINAAMRTTHHIFNRFWKRSALFLCSLTALDDPVNQYRYQYAED